MSNRNCAVCGASWINDQLFWRTGKSGKDEDLNALVCRRLEGPKFNSCPNPMKGAEGGIGLEKRMKMLEQGLDGL
jgi:hypothetical protein